MELEGEHSTTKLPGSVAFYDTRPGNEVGLFYNAPEPTRDSKIHAYHESQMLDIHTQVHSLYHASWNTHRKISMQLILSGLQALYKPFTYLIKYSAS